MPQAVELQCIHKRLANAAHASESKLLWPRQDINTKEAAACNKLEACL